MSWPEPRAKEEGETIDQIALIESAKERGRLVTGFELRDAFANNLRIETGLLEQPMAALQLCLEELTSHWGIDVEAHRQLSRPVKRVNFEVWARSIRESYPAELNRRGEQAKLRVRLTVSPEGKAVGCHIQAQIGDDAFREQACRTLLEEAQYEPALDGQGNPITSYDVLLISYYT